MDSLKAREALFKKMNGETSIHSSLVREAVSLLNEQRETIERYEKALNQIKELPDLERRIAQKALEV